MMDSKPRTTFLNSFILYFGVYESQKAGGKEGAELSWPADH